MKQIIIAEYSGGTMCNVVCDPQGNIEPGEPFITIEIDEKDIDYFPQFWDDFLMNLHSELFARCSSSPRFKIIAFINTQYYDETLFQKGER